MLFYVIKHMFSPFYTFKPFVLDYGAGDSYGSPLPPEVLEHNPKLKFYQPALISQNFHHYSGTYLFKMSKVKNKGKCCSVVYKSTDLKYYQVG